MIELTPAERIANELDYLGDPDAETEARPLDPTADQIAAAVVTLDRTDLATREEAQIYVLAFVQHSLDLAATEALAEYRTAAIRRARAMLAALPQWSPPADRTGGDW